MLIETNFKTIFSYSTPNTNYKRRPNNHPNQYNKNMKSHHKCSNEDLKQEYIEDKRKTHLITSIIFL